MNLEQAVLELENPRTDPTSAIECLIAEEHDAARILLAHLAALQAGFKPPLEIALSPPHPLTHGLRFRFPRRIHISAAKVATRRIVIALGAVRSTAAVPVLLDLLARASFDAKLGEAIGWALANIGDAALLPLFAFARRRKTPAPARSLAILTLGYIADPRVPTILNNLWREYRLEEPRLAIAALLGMTVCGLGEEARARAVETERMWRARDTRRDARTGTEFGSATEMLRDAFDKAPAAESLPAWPSVLQMLGSR